MCTGRGSRQSQPHGRQVAPGRKPHAQGLCSSRLRPPVPGPTGALACHTYSCHDIFTAGVTGLKRQQTPTGVMSSPWSLIISNSRSFPTFFSRHAASRPPLTRMLGTQRACCQWHNHGHALTKALILGREAQGLLAWSHIPLGLKSPQLRNIPVQVYREDSGYTTRKGSFRGL